MSENNEIGYLLDEIAAQLDAIVQQLGDGLDVAPTRRLQLEGLTAASLAAGIDAEALLQFCRAHLPGDAAVSLIANGSALQFELWQRRAPVYPTTND